jgi:glycosyltransferase involved in cell wall biosynthesis
MMWGGAFPEPLTFSIRALRVLAERAGDFDVVHDNQGLGYGMLGVRRLGLPLVTSIHHPISVDKRIDLASSGRLTALNKRRWYGFVRMQARVARRLAGTGPLITVSESSRDDICRDFRVPRERIRIIPLGVDTRVFRPRSERMSGRIVVVASADAPLKGIGTLLRAMSKLATERDVHLIVVSKPSQQTEQLVGELSLAGKVRFRPGLSEADLAALLATAEIGVVPSMYEGFSLTAVEHMASGTPLVASRVGALPEVTGGTALLTSAGDVDELAATLKKLHDSPTERTRLAGLALARVNECFTWPAVAAATAECYRSVIVRRAAC